MCKDKSGSQSDYNGGFIALSPKGHPINLKLERFFKEVYAFDVVWYESEAEMNSFIKSYDYSKEDNDGVRMSLCLGVSFKTSERGNWDYSIHMNTTKQDGSFDFYPKEQNQIFLFKKEEFSAWKSNQREGSAYLMTLIDNLILQQDTSTSSAYINPIMAQTPVLGYKSSDVYDIGQAALGNFFTLILLIVNLRFVYNITQEKELRITENMRNMGMSMYNHYFSWIIWGFFTYFLSSIPIVIILKLSMFSGTNILSLWLFYYLPGCVMISFGFFISSFFINAKPAVLTTLVLFFGFYGMSIVMNLYEKDLTEFQNTLLAISPISSISKIGNILLIIQGTYSSFTISMMFLEYFNFRFISFILLSLLEIVVFCLLGIWIDQIIPSEIGVKKHPLFCFGLRRREYKGAPGEDNDALDSSVRSHLFEVNEEDDRSSDRTKLKIRKLEKLYSNGKKAVNGLNLTMYKDEIFGLLGHNGAGKTTTISMISGLLPISSGSIKIFGMDSITQMDEIKSIMGVCPQKNPIFDSLTVYEHLKLFANIKNSKHKQIENEIDQILKDIDLFDKKNFFAGKLSGGQKRKLCVAISFIGGSKIVLLDEPTSGMDTAARRHLWDMLKKYKKDRIIILTTHFMDEADYLGDRIGIMGEGRLLTCGSSLFLKNKFGAGYSLTIVKNSQKISTQNLTEEIKRTIQSAALEGDIGMEVKYNLPTNQLNNFESLFRNLETKREAFGIQSFGIDVTTLEEVFLKVAVGIGNQENVDDMEPNVDGDNKSQIQYALEEQRITSTFHLFCTHFYALIKKRYIYFKRDGKGLACEILLPGIVIFIGLLMTLISFIKDVPAWSVAPDILPESYSVWVDSSNFDFESSIKNYKSSYLPDITRKAFSDVNSFDSELMKNCNDGKKRYFSLSEKSIDKNNHKYEYYGFFNTSVPNSYLIALKQGNVAAYRLAMGDKNANIITRMSSFPITRDLEGFTGSIDGFFAVFFIILAFSFIPSSNIMFIVMEREANVKHQQLISGVGILAYWLSSLLLDFIKYLIVFGITIAALFIYNIETYLHGQKLVMTLLLLGNFGLSMIIFTYLTSFLFKTPSSAQISTFVINFVFGFVLTMGSFSLRMIESTRSFSLNGLEFLFRLLPMFDLSFGLMNMAYDNLYYLTFSLSEIPTPFSRYGAIFELVFIVVTPVIYFLIIIILEKCTFRKEPKITEVYGTVPTKQIDVDVAEEANNVFSNPEEYAIRVNHLSKTYRIVSSGSCFGGKVIQTKKAVRDISFGIKAGECFGLLGTNGAGKTTTFKMLCGEIPPSNGSASIYGKNVATNMKHLRHLIGYCPQFDAILDNLTAREHLELYAAIKGIPSNLREPLIKEKLEQLNLKKFEHVQAGTYSGGNKRKLSVAMALLGSPPIIFLDEPSSGMDPEARRFMWNVVSKVSKLSGRSSIILTTHSMEEAEALSSKLAIMVEGEFKCIGPVTSLKERFGKGYEIECKIRDPSMEELNRVVEKLQNFPSGQLNIETMISKEQLATNINALNARYSGTPLKIENADSFKNEVTIDE